MYNQVTSHSRGRSSLEQHAAPTRQSWNILSGIQHRTYRNSGFILCRGQVSKQRILDALLFVSGGYDGS
ncbi:uncharacterized protein EI90DRAFT_3052982, partial [Cantharellus anzutake]|uniref:uncharacterized protein n=1 Tax=Cantharellus anzutake TaxID=1750568 RepID=UPI0019086E2B